MNSNIIKEISENLDITIKVLTLVFQVAIMI